MSGRCRVREVALEGGPPECEDKPAAKIAPLAEGQRTGSGQRVIDLGTAIDPRVGGRQSAAPPQEPFDVP